MRTDIDHRIRVAELDRIVDQVVEHLLDLSEVRVNNLYIIAECQVQDDIFCMAGSFERSSRVLDHTIDIEIASGEETLAVHGTDGQHTLGQLVQSLSLRNDNV